MPQLRAFGVGAAKTGTHSLAVAFGKTLKSAHEPDASEIVSLIIAAHTQQLDASEYHRQLRSLIDGQGLELNVSHPLGFAIRELFTIYPSALYVLTVRDAESWLASFINHQLTRPTSENWRKFRDLRFCKGFHPDRPEDKPATTKGLYSVDAYLSHWVRHSFRVIKTVPSSQLCILGTKYINRDLPRISSFLGFSIDLAFERAHEFRGNYNSSVNIEISPSYLAERIGSYTDLLIELTRPHLNTEAMLLLQEALGR